MQRRLRENWENAIMTDLPPVYRARDFPFFLVARFLSEIAMQITSVAIGWQIYDIEHTPLALGFVGLCQFVPMFLLTLPAGEMADRFDQRRVLSVAQMVQASCAGLFLFCSLHSPRHALPFCPNGAYIFGASRGFSSHSNQSLLAFLVPSEAPGGNRSRKTPSVFTVAVIAGPALGGFFFSPRDRSHDLQHLHVRFSSGGFSHGHHGWPPAGPHRRGSRVRVGSALWRESVLCAASR